MGKKDIQIKYPAGWRGITATTTREDTQEELFLPTENILIAVNAEGDVEMGTIVVDLDKDNQIDGDRAARLQSAFRVIKYPFGEDNCAIALQLGPSGKKDTKGYFVDRMSSDKPGSSGGYPPVYTPGGQAEDGIAIAQGSFLEGGPFHCGTGKCDHKRGEDDEGNPISSLHIYYKALFRKDDKLDGPLKFEDQLPPPDKDLDQRIDCHLSWDKNKKIWYWWTTSPLIPAPWNPPTIDPHIPGPGWNDPSSYPKVNIDPNGVPTQGAGGSGGKGGGSGGGGGPGETRPGVPTYDKFNQRPDGSKLSDPAPAQTAVSSIASNPTAGMYLQAALSPLMAPAYAFRPQNYTPGQLETGVFSPPSSLSKVKANNAPISMIASAFAAQGGQTAASGGYGPSESGAQGDPWAYNQQPAKSKVANSKNSKYFGGTANGGVVFHPPETDLRDAATLAMQPTNVTLSTCYVLASPSCYFAAGTPQLVSGSLKDGYSWGTEASTGDLVFRSHSNSQAPVEAFRLTKTSQNIRWMSGLTVYGEFDHANSANRTYTFPDVSGTVMLSGAPGIASTLCAGSNGQGISFAEVDELTTIAAAATTDTAIQIPLNAVVLAVTVRVTVVIPTAATFTVTGTSSGTQFDVAGGVSAAANTTDLGDRNCPYKNGNAQTIRITPNAVPAANTGRVRVTIHYYLPVAPTS